MKVRPRNWDYRTWVITILTTLTLAGGGYTVRTLAAANDTTRAEIEVVKKQAVDLANRQAVDDERFKEIREDMTEVKLSIKDVRDILIRTHMKELKEERPPSKR